MINVLVSYKNSCINEVEVSGHAQFADSGKDLVCAGVSSIVVGTMNALDILANDTCDFKMNQGHINIYVNKQEVSTELILKTMIIQLETIAEKYYDYIKITKLEV